MDNEFNPMGLHLIFNVEKEMKRCKRPTEPGHYWYHHESEWIKVKVGRIFGVGLDLWAQAFPGHTQWINDMKGWWGPRCK